MIRVLLISPTDPEKPKGLKLLVGGENTYTQTLLNNPPRGVTYTYHMEALKKGLISYLPLHYLLKNLVKFRILPLSAGTEAIKINADFDLIHCHGYSVKIEGKELPIVMSDSSSNYLFLRDYVNWPEWRMKIGFWIRRWLFEWFGVIDCDTNWQGAKKIIVFSKFAEKIHENLGVPSKKIEVVYPGIDNPTYFSNEMRSYHSSQRHSRLFEPEPFGSEPQGRRPQSRRPDRESISLDSRFRHSQTWQSRLTRRGNGRERAGKFSLRSNNNSDEVNILFVGIWFERKGGPILLEAFKKLSKKYPNIKLTIVGEVPKRYKLSYSSNEMRSYPKKNNSSDGKFSLRSNNIRWIDYVPREKLMREIFPKADIFVLVPPVAEGLGFAVLEAMSFGIPSVVSRVYALPELIEDGKSGFVIDPGSKDQLVKKLEILITNRRRRQAMGEAARKKFELKFSVEVLKKKLRDIYDKAAG